MFLGQGMMGAAGCQTPSLVLLPAALGAGKDSPLLGGKGTRNLCSSAVGQPLRVIVTRGKRPERGIVLSLPALLGMLVFWVIKQL